ncbi:hypothetical protein HAX54_049868, partial [Datura stramonium]|nr:hypothetical protein [Datura stramonium]
RILKDKIPVYDIVARSEIVVVSRHRCCANSQQETKEYLFLTGEFGGDTLQQQDSRVPLCSSNKEVYKCNIDVTVKGVRLDLDHGLSALKTEGGSYSCFFVDHQRSDKDKDSFFMLTPLGNNDKRSGCKHG